MSFACRTNLAPATLQRILPAHVVESLPAGSSPASGSEFCLQAYLSNIPPQPFAGHHPGDRLVGDLAVIRRVADEAFPGRGPPHRGEALQQVMPEEVWPLEASTPFLELLERAALLRSDLADGGHKQWLGFGKGPRNPRRGCRK